MSANELYIWFAYNPTKNHRISRLLLACEFQIRCDPSTYSIESSSVPQCYWWFFLRYHPTWLESCHDLYTLSLCYLSTISTSHIVSPGWIFLSQSNTSNLQNLVSTLWIGLCLLALLNELVASDFRLFSPWVHLSSLPFDAHCRNSSPVPNWSTLPSVFVLVSLPFPVYLFESHEPFLYRKLPLFPLSYASFFLLRIFSIFRCFFSNISFQLCTWECSVSNLNSGHSFLYLFTVVCLFSKYTEAKNHFVLCCVWAIYTRNIKWPT